MKSLKGFRGLILGLIIGIIFATVGTATADNNSVTGVYGEFKYLINGKTITIPSNAVVVDGKALFSIRDIANALNYEVEYEDSTRTIGLSNDGKKHLKKENDGKVETSSVTPEQSNQSNQSTNVSNANVSSQGFTYEKLPITKTIKGVTITINSITLTDKKTAFDITVKNENTFDIKLDTQKSMKTNMEVEGKLSKMVGYSTSRFTPLEGMIDFTKTFIRAGEEKRGIAYQGLIEADTERINFFPSANEAIATFSFYIDTKGSL